jgi:hypothetical protein
VQFIDTFRDWLGGNGISHYGRSDGQTSQYGAAFQESSAIGFLRSYAALPLRKDEQWNTDGCSVFAALFQN